MCPSSSSLICSLGCMREPFLKFINLGCLEWTVQSRLTPTFGSSQYWYFILQGKDRNYRIFFLFYFPSKCPALNETWKPVSQMSRASMAAFGLMVDRMGQTASLLPDTATDMDLTAVLLPSIWYMASRFWGMQGRKPISHFVCKSIPVIVFWCDL